jgi:hypothetical protein
MTLCSTLGAASVARAADTEPPATSESTPGANEASVNPSSEKKHVLAPSAQAIPLQLKPKVVYPPLHFPKGKYEEVRIWGLTIPTFVAYGLSGVSAGGAVITGYAASRGNQPSNCVDARCTEHGVHNKALWITTGVLTGMAVVGLSLGVTFMVKAKTSPSHDSIKPRLDLGFSGEKAEAKIGWVFSSL